MENPCDIYDIIDEKESVHLFVDDGVIYVSVGYQYDQWVKSRKKGPESGNSFVCIRVIRGLNF